jgi:hypothetical protein
MCIYLRMHNFCYSTHYCAPSDFSELRPARRISSVERRFIAITELEEADVNNREDAKAKRHCIP